MYSNKSMTNDSYVNKYYIKETVVFDLCVTIYKVMTHRTVVTITQHKQHPFSMYLSQCLFTTIQVPK